MDIDIHRRLCYIYFIKKILICLLCLFSLLPTAGAKIDANQLLGGLLQVINEPQQPAKWEFGGLLFLSEQGTLVPKRLFFSGLEVPCSERFEPPPNRHL